MDTVIFRTVYVMELVIFEAPKIRSTFNAISGFEGFTNLGFQSIAIPSRGYRAVAVFLIGPDLLSELCSRIVSCYLCTFETEIGLGLTLFGIAFTFFGVILFFDQKLLAMGNILFLFGVTLTIGPMYTMQFFMKRQNLKGTMAFGSGFALLILGWPFFGMILEGYGSIVLFSGFWPTLAVFLQRIPFFGWILRQPFIASLLNRSRGKRVPV
ncbi:Vesicle transport protein, Got1/SFT2-like [Dillenia turbinata]|uniref:Vesicle transport protein, Got1/SFT2-like n=1 Tax=Dillenia turbinata TaxID=194707 RepID=A0AAN8Z418_9MAGN